MILCMALSLERRLDEPGTMLSVEHESPRTIASCPPHMSIKLRAHLIFPERDLIRHGCAFCLVISTDRSGSHQLEAEESPNDIL